MSKFLRFSVLLLAAALIVGLAGCLDKDDNPEETPEETEVDYSSHNADYSILVRNNTSQRLVAFKGDLMAETLIGGIPARAQNHGLPKNPALFDKTEDFPLILLTEAQYNANKNDLGSLKNTPFTRVYVFYNANGDNTAVYKIAEGLGGTNKLTIINNSSSINVELRSGGENGETLGYSPAGMLTTDLYLLDGDYYVFPVFKRYNSFRDVIEEVIPKASDNSAWYQSIGFGEGTTTDTINLTDILSVAKFTLGAAWVVINNQTTGGAIQFMEGSYTYETATGLRNIPNGNPRTFQLNMPKIGTTIYAESMQVSNWRFGTPTRNVALTEGTGENAPTGYTGTFEILQDKMYTITVTGNLNEASTLKAWVSDVTDIQSDLAGK